MKKLIILAILLFIANITLANEFYSSKDEQDQNILQELSFDNLSKDSVLSFKKPIVIPKPSSRALPNCSDRIQLDNIRGQKISNGGPFAKSCRLCTIPGSEKKRSEALVTKLNSDYVVNKVSTTDQFVTINLLSPSKKELNFICSGFNKVKVSDMTTALSAHGIEIKVAKLKEAKLNKKSAEPQDNSNQWVL